MAKTMGDFLLDSIREVNTITGFGLSEDVGEWHQMGIYTPKQFYWYLDEPFFVNVYKSIYNVKPREFDWSHADVIEWLEQNAYEPEEA